MSALYIGIYFLCWALFHSLLASLRIKRLAGRIFGGAARRWYRLDLKPVPLFPSPL